MNNEWIEGEPWDGTLALTEAALEHGARLKIVYSEAGLLVLEEQWSGENQLVLNYVAGISANYVSVSWSFCFGTESRDVESTDELVEILNREIGKWVRKIKSE